MTSSVINTLPAMGLAFTNTTAKSGPAMASALWRRQGTIQVVIALSWIVAVNASFLAVGIIGVFADDLPPIHLKTLADLDHAIEQPMIETSMAELQTLEASEEQPAETEPVLPVEIPEAIETPPQNLDLPEIAEAMSVEDIFAIPTAPKIEDALRPVDPVVKPKPKPVLTPPRPRTPVASSGTRSSTPQTGAAGGTGTAGSSGRGKFPAPPYPDFARGAGMQGTVRLSISVGPSGAVESVTVMGSTGFNSLDEYAASWVRRNWRWPGGSASRYTLPLTFRLR